MKLISNSYGVGVVVGAFIVLGIIVSAVWFPWFGDEDYRELREFAFFTAFAFFVLISRNWRFHKRLRLWVSLTILVVAHSSGVLLFITHVRPLGPREYILILFLDIFVGLVFLDWAMRVGRGISASDSAGKGSASL